MKHTLSSKLEVTLKEMSVDDIDYCNDLPQMRYENNEVVGIMNLAKARTSNPALYHTIIAKYDAKRKELQ